MLKRIAGGQIWEVVKLLMAVLIGLPFCVVVVWSLTWVMINLLSLYAWSLYILSFTGGVSIAACLWLIGPRFGWKVTSAAVSAALVTICIGWVWSTTVWRDREYHRIIGEFEQASPLAKGTVDSLGNPGWNADLLVTGGPKVHLRASEHFDVATVYYADEALPRRVFEPADYTNIHDVRRSGDMLYVLRSITLLRVEYRLTVFDLRNHSVLADRRVDWLDLN